MKYGPHWRKAKKEAKKEKITDTHSDEAKSEQMVKIDKKAESPRQRKGVWNRPQPETCGWKVRKQRRKRHWH